MLPLCANLDGFAIKAGELQGYRLAQFEDAFARYL